MKIMIKKIIGIVALLAILALIVYTAIGAGTYKSMLPEDMFTKKDVVATEIVKATEAPAADDVNPTEAVEQITE
jgi:hypothetical protein